MKREAEFDEIRPYYDEELPQVIEELIEDPEFQRVAGYVVPEIPFDVLAAKMRQCKSKTDFQKEFCYDIIWKIAKSCCDGLSLDHSSLPDKIQSYTYISNHRDIVLDSGFLSVLLVGQGMSTVEIAIGDNLLIYPWIKKIVRINKSFIVQRSANMRQKLDSSARLSRYIHFAIAEKNESVWIAQREGRAKDSDDRTQDSLLKMLAMGGEGDIIERLKSLNIVPVSISYEYDPCDFLKAKEFQQKRDLMDYKKSTSDDLKNMETGLFGYKGRVHFKTGERLDETLDTLDRTLPKQELLLQISAWIDKQIHRNYSLYPGNYIAAELLSDDTCFADKYTIQQKKHFEDYVSGQISKIDLPHKDMDFLYKKMLQMYANPLINYLASMR